MGGLARARPILGALFFAAGCRGAQPTPPPAAAVPSPAPPPTADVPSPTWRVPDGYKTETIPFPLDFAPSLKHTGVEELRFAPGFFKPDQPGYFTYTFVWAIDDVPEWPLVRDELHAYFRGLMEAVGKGRKLAVPASAFDVRLTADADHARGTIAAFDAFMGRDVHLNAEAFRSRCAKGAVYAFAISPKSFTEPPADGALALAKEATCATRFQ